MSDKWNGYRPTAPPRLITYQQLLEALQELTPEQRAMTATVSAGCDENGNAEFFAVDALTLAKNPDINAAVDGVLDSDEQPVILFAE